jgi:hypothetical protein
LEKYEIEQLQDFKKYLLVQKNGNGIGKNLIPLMLVGVDLDRKPRKSKNH